MHPSEYDNIARCADTHWWYRGLRALTRDALAALPPEARAGQWCDIGCGTGHLLGLLPNDVPPVGVEWSAHGLRHARMAADSALVQGSVNALPLADSALRGATLMDVLYHSAVPDKRTALREIARVLEPGGALIVNVPAYAWLHSNHDRVIMTDKRFTRRELIALLDAAGFDVVRCTYWNTILMPLIVAARVFQRGGEGKSDVSEAGTMMNMMGSFALATERAWLRFANLPAGVSIFAVARKR